LRPSQIGQKEQEEQAKQNTWPHSFLPHFGIQTVRHVPAFDDNELTLAEAGLRVNQENVSTFRVCNDYDE
jgi:hypothetical protein